MKVLFYPDPPVQLPGHTLSKTIEYFNILRYELTNDINEDWDFAVHWKIFYNDVFYYKTPNELLYDKRLVLNFFCNNVGKSYVDEIFKIIFGYSSFWDTSKIGFCVKKSEKQSAHDGEIIRTPCIKEIGYVYQKLIDNRMSENMVYDIRVPVILNLLPCVFIKSKSIEGTFEHSRSNKLKYWYDKIENWFNKDEIEKIKKFCLTFSLDIGELDILRDNSTGQIYVTDVNTTPGGDLFRHIENGQKIKEQLAKQLDELIKQKLNE